MPRNSPFESPIRAMLVSSPVVLGQGRCWRARAISRVRRRPGRPSETAYADGPKSQLAYGVGGSNHGPTLTPPDPVPHRGPRRPPCDALANDRTYVGRSGRQAGSTTCATRAINMEPRSDAYGTAHGNGRPRVPDDRDRAVRASAIYAGGPVLTICRQQRFAQARHPLQVPGLDASRCPTYPPDRKASMR